MALYRLERKNPINGLREQITYTGDLKQKPIGWKVVEKLSASQGKRK